MTHSHPPQDAPASTDPKARRAGALETILQWLWLLPLVIVFLVIQGIVYRHGLHHPFSDEFDLPGRIIFLLSQGTFSLRELWAWHTDAHMVFPKLFWTIEAALFGWSVKTTMYLGVVIVAAEALLLCLLLRIRIFDQKAKCLIGLAFALLLLHTGSSSATFLRGIQYVVIVPAFLLVMGSYLYTKLDRIGAVMAVYCCCSTVATLTFPNGIALWLLLYPFIPVHKIVASKDRTQIRKVIVYSLLSFLAAAALLGCYFIGYRSISADESSKVVDPEYVRYFLSWMGAPLAFSLPKDYPWIFGLGALLFSIFLTGYVLFTAFTKRHLGRLALAWPWLMLVAYGLLSGIACARGRAVFGMSQSLSERYYLISLQGLLGVLGLWIIATMFQADGTRRIQQPLLQTLFYLGVVGIVIFRMATWEAGLERISRHVKARSQEQLALNLWDEAPQITPIPYPLPGAVRDRYLTLVRSGFLNNQGDGVWLKDALKTASTMDPVAEAQVRGEGKDLRVRVRINGSVAKTATPAILTVLELPDDTARPIAVDYLTPHQKEKTTKVKWSLPVTPFRRSSSPDAHVDALSFYLLDPTKKKAFLLEKT